MRRFLLIFSTVLWLAAFAAAALGLVVLALVLAQLAVDLSYVPLLLMVFSRKRKP